MKKFLIFLYLFTFNCSSERITNNHGFTSLQVKYEKITINKSNKNDILSIIGPPSSISSFDKNKWFYIQRAKTNQSLFKLGIKKIEKNNILVVAFNERGILEDKVILDKNNMNDVKFVKEITKKEFKQNDFLFKLLSSFREKANAPSRNKKNNRK
tara:strand:+ start:56 stop:520 length:465 start_codon:yes stop_codon:yes gene_type:complete